MITCDKLTICKSGALNVLSAAFLCHRLNLFISLSVQHLTNSSVTW